MVANFIATYKADQNGYKPHIAAHFKEDASEKGSLARVFGTKKPGTPSEDSCLLATGFGKPTRSQGLNLLDEAFAEAHEAALDVGRGGATLAAALKTSEGIAVRLAGDAVVSLIGKNGEVYQITKDQVVLGKSKQTGNIVDNPYNGIGAVCRGKSPSTDDAYFLTYEQIEQLVGKDAQVVVMSDGVFDKANNYLPAVAARFERGDPVNDLPIIKRQEQMEFLKTAVKHLAGKGYHAGDADFANALAAYVRQTGGADDIGIVAIPATRPVRAEDYALAVVSDGMGGEGAGDKVSQAATKAMESMLKDKAVEFGVPQDGGLMRISCQDFDPEAPIRGRGNMLSGLLQKFRPGAFSLNVKIDLGIGEFLDNVKEQISAFQIGSKADMVLNTLGNAIEYRMHRRDSDRHIHQVGVVPTLEQGFQQLRAQGLIDSAAFSNFSVNGGGQIRALQMTSRDPGHLVILQKAFEAEGMRTELHANYNVLLIRETDLRVAKGMDAVVDFAKQARGALTDLQDDVQTSGVGWKEKMAARDALKAVDTDRTRH
ncbi:MAG: hypothetical protein J0L97_08505 [Alphaproteobacteria bacterium]|nr:hypothetical protein [Alphaproteobacteria bacterium]